MKTQMDWDKDILGIIIEIQQKFQKKRVRK